LRLGWTQQGTSKQPFYTFQPKVHPYYCIFGLAMWAWKGSAEKEEVGHCSLFYCRKLVCRSAFQYEAFFIIFDILLSPSLHISVSSSFRFVSVISTPCLEREGMSMFYVESWVTIESLLIYINFSSLFFLNVHIKTKFDKCSAFLILKSFECVPVTMYLYPAT